MMPAFLVTFFQVKKVTAFQIRNNEKILAKRVFKYIRFMSFNIN